MPENIRYSIDTGQRTDDGGVIYYLTESQLSEIIERAASRGAEQGAEQVFEKLTRYICEEVGRSVLQRLFYLVGAAVIALSVYLHNKGLL